MTVGALVDRILREWLYRIGNRPIQTELVGAVAATDTELTFDSDLLTYEEAAAAGANSYVEIEAELVRILDYADTGIAQVRRGQDGTTAAAHAAGTLASINPEYPRAAILGALGDEIVSLYPQLRRTATTYALNSSFWELPASAQTIISIRDRAGNLLGGELLTGFAEVDSGAAVLFDHPTEGEAWVTYAYGFDRPSAETQDLADLGIEDRWQRLLIFGTLSNLLRGKELDLASLEFLTEAIEAAGLQLGQITSVATAFGRMRDLFVLREQQALMARTGIHSVTTRVI